MPVGPDGSMLVAMKGRTGHMLAFALMIVAATWVFVQSRDRRGAPGTGGPPAAASTKEGGRHPEPGQAGGKPAKRDRPREGEGGGRTTLRGPASDSYLSAATARSESASLVEDAMQLADPGKRDRALEVIRAALAGPDEMAAYAALHAYVGIKDLKIDRAAFRELVEPWLDAGDAGMRRMAWCAFADTERRPGDVARVRALADDPSEVVRRSVSHLLSIYEKGDFTGASGETVLGMLEREGRPVRREVLRGMWGATLSPELEAKVIALSRSSDRDEMHDAVYFALSTSANKSSAAVDRLIEVLADPDVVNNAGRAAWGLRQGVDEADRARVADAAMTLLETRRRGTLWNQAAELLGRHGSSQHRAGVERMLEDPGLDPRSRTSLRQVLERVGGR